MKLLDQYGKPIRASAAQLREEVATPTLAGVRPVISGHPADGLTPARLAAILRNADEGHGLDYLELAEEIEERDLHYAAVLGTRKRAVAQLPITVEAASDDAEHVRHRDFVAEWVKSGVLEEALFDMLDAIGKGFSVMEIMWRTEPGLIVPGELKFRPARWFEPDPADGETVMMKSGALREPLAPHKFVVHKHPQKSGLLLRSGLARLAMWAWMYKAFTLRDWAVFVQNYGQPMRVGRYGPEATKAEKDVLWRAVSNIAGDCAAIIPRGMEIEFVEAGDKKDGSALYQARADWLDRQISKAVLGQTTTTDAISGGHAVSQEHRLVQEDIERADARVLSVTLTRQLAAPIVAFNFGPQAAYPVLRIGRPDEVPLKDIVAAVKDLGPQGLRVEASEIRDRLGLSEPEEGAEVIGGRAAPVNVPNPPPPSLQSIRRLVLSRHATAPDPELLEALTERTARDAAGAMAALTDQVQELMAQSGGDLRVFGERLAALQLDPSDLARAIGQGMAVAHLAGEAAVLDELKGE